MKRHILRQTITQGNAWKCVWKSAPHPRKRGQINYLMRYKQQLMDDEWINNKPSSSASAFVSFYYFVASWHVATVAVGFIALPNITRTPSGLAIIPQCFCLSNGVSMRCAAGVVLQRHVSSNWTRDFRHSARYNVPEYYSKQSTMANISRLPLFHLPPCFHLFSVFLLYKYDV